MQFHSLSIRIPGSMLSHPIRVSVVGGVTMQHITHLLQTNGLERKHTRRITLDPTRPHDFGYVHFIFVSVRIFTTNGKLEGLRRASSIVRLTRHTEPRNAPMSEMNR